MKTVRKIAALIAKNLHIYKRQKLAYNKGVFLFGRLFDTCMGDGESIRVIRNANRYRNYFMGRVHSTTRYN